MGGEVDPHVDTMMWSWASSTSNRRCELDCSQEPLKNEPLATGSCDNYDLCQWRSHSPRSITMYVSPMTASLISTGLDGTFVNRRGVLFEEGHKSTHCRKLGCTPNPYHNLCIAIFPLAQVKHVVPGSVAHRAGLEPGNTIVRVNGQWVIGMADSEACFAYLLRKQESTWWPDGQGAQFPSSPSPFSPSPALSF